VLHWLAGGALLGAVLLVAVALVKPLGVSTQYVRAVGGIAEVCAPGAAAANPYLAEEGVKLGYGEMVVLGIPLGALRASALLSRRTREAVPAPWAERFGPSRALRFAGATAGGFLLLFGARMAGGCTSGHILSGVSQLAVSSILFAIAAFGTAILTARAMYPATERGES
jgi:uncharacterized membrane protein YedE/YeeE